MTVLVVGGTGFVGSAVVRRLVEDGADVAVLTRSGGAPEGARDLRGDATLPDLGLGREREALAGGVTHIVSCFGSVDWGAGPVLAEHVHGDGTRALLTFARGCPRLERLVHVSSILQFGRATGRVGNREQDLGQDFRTWYEYGKYVAERALREDDSVPWCTIRVGPVLGTVAGAPPPARDGLLALMPYVLRGYPVPLVDGGRFPAYPCDAGTLAVVVARALEDAPPGTTWTWYDRESPTLASVVTGLCAAWGTLPRLIRAPHAARLFYRAASAPLGLPKALVDYCAPWVDVDPAVLTELPPGLPNCPPDYIEATGVALRGHSMELVA